MATKGTKSAKNEPVSIFVLLVLFVANAFA
jgi:hypothetical protein